MITFRGVRSFSFAAHSSPSCFSEGKCFDKLWQSNARVGRDEKGQMKKQERVNVGQNEISSRAWVWEHRNDDSASCTTMVLRLIDRRLGDCRLTLLSSEIEYRLESVSDVILGEGKEENELVRLFYHLVFSFYSVKDVERTFYGNARQKLCNGSRNKLLSVVVHPQETAIQHVHEAIPETANFCATRLSMTEGLQLENALCEGG